MAQPFSPPPGGVEVTGRDGLLCLDLAENVTEKEGSCLSIGCNVFKMLYEGHFVCTRH